MTSSERILTALRLEEPDRVPFAELNISPEVAKQAMKSDKEITRPEAIKFFQCDTIQFWSGAPNFAKKAKAGDGHEYFVDGLIKTNDDLKLLKLPDPHNEERLEKARQFVKANKDLATFAVINLGFDPMVFSMGIEGFSYALYENRSLVETILDTYADWYVAVVPHLIEIGFDFIWAADDLAYKTGPMFSPQVFRELLLPRFKRIAEKITIPWTYHSDGNLMPILDDLLSLGMNGLHPIEPGAMDIYEMKKRYGDKVCLMGNISVDLLSRGTPDEVEADVKEHIEKLAPGGGYIISSSNSITNYCKPENIIAMRDAVLKYGEYNCPSSTSIHNSGCRLFTEAATRIKK